MYEKRHIVANLLMLIIAYLIDRLMNYLTFGSNLSQLVNNLSILLLVIPILMIIFSVVITLMFSSIIVSFLYYVTAIAYALIISNNVDFNLILSTFLNLLGYYALATIVIGAILGISRRSFPDEILLNISRLNVNISKNKIIYGGLFVVVSFLVFYEVLSNLFLFIGSMASFVLTLLVSNDLVFPLIILSWFSFPFLFTQLATYSIKEKGIELGYIEGILAPSLVNRISNTKYGWRKFSNLKFHLNFDESKNYNIVILGTSGSGKSSLAKSIIGKFSDISYLVFDLHGEYEIESGERIDISKNSLNPLSLNGASPRQRALEVAYMLRSIFRLGNLQTIDIFNIIMDTYAEKGIDENDESSWNSTPPTFRDVLLMIERRKKLVENSQDLSRLSSIEPYIQFLSNQILSGNSLDMKKIFEGNIILDFSKVATDELKYILIETILRDFRNYLYRRGISRLWKFLVIDEAPFILGKETGLEIVERLFAEVRKFGVGMILISQITENIENIFQNSSYIFIFNVVEPKELDYLSRALGGSDRDRYEAIYQAIRSLERGHVVTISGDSRDILLVKLNSLK
ncbi:ATP-binding protein [Saccharolobus islandicus]|uniref:AAA ATPase n=2 Tax=Saccharolobus islandicus TaxID=43080 RepID=F0NHS9_SACI5|nr:ATP-binding protein [Sulfolobus islandicus]ADX85668.1 AAA ATPase [Sulfolobus islandicus REY15A]AGJ63042.1 putative ATPase [Sulfolobus islandicus LAL14/1]